MPDQDTAQAVGKIRPWPEGVPRKNRTRELLAAYRAAFDSDPDAHFGAAEMDGVTIVIARGEAGFALKEFVRAELHGIIEYLPRHPASSSQESSNT